MSSIQSSAQSSTHYTAVVDIADDGTFGIWFPDLSGCTSAADTPDEIVPNARIALGMFLEDEPAPKRRRTSVEIAQDPAVRDALARGGFLQMIPFAGEPVGRNVRITLSLDSGHLAAIDAMAKSLGKTRSGFMVDSALDAINSA